MNVKLLEGEKVMGQAVSISKQIFRRWCEKLRKDRTVPQTLVEELELLREQQKLSDAEALGQLLNQVGRGDYDQD